MTSLFITVGSTSFPQLTDLALSPAFLSILAQTGIADVVVQYGSADITVPPVAQNGRMSGKGESTFVYTVQDEDGEGGVSDRARGYSGNREGSTGAGASGYSSETWGRGQVNVRFLRYTSEFDKEVARADVVISHAGSGSILSALRAHKPLLVVPNNSLMDDHQSELARVLQQDGYMDVSTVATLMADLPSFIARARSHIDTSTSASDTDRKEWSDRKSQQGFRPFPSLAPGRFAGILGEVAGFSP